MNCIRRKLKALKYPQASSFQINDQQTIQNFIVWLEDQHIRLYKIEDRKKLRNFTNPSWEESLQKYLKDVNCPFSKHQLLPMVDWLLGHAIRLEYADNADKYNAVHYPQPQDIKTENTTSGVYNIDVNDPDFKSGVTSLAKILDIPLHEDYFITLKAINKFVQSRLTKEAIEQSKVGGKVSSIPLDKAEVGFNLNDPALNQAACALRMLYINDLREFQTKINEAIVAVQSITANPKTDQRLGRVGR